MQFASNIFIKFYFPFSTPPQFPLDLPIKFYVFGPMACVCVCVVLVRGVSAWYSCVRGVCVCVCVWVRVCVCEKERERECERGKGLAQQFIPKGECDNQQLVVILR